ncbi:hypothetical protein Xcc3_25210 [Xanthomonas campestris pv. campestris]|nr:hypothetical protein Xcc1_25120 [Xanthomonas campestris pv. campestris]BBK01214.1 hypothetical protein Xcc3_25210 [Xanthomonas campestris pv. campestris]
MPIAAGPLLRCMTGATKSGYQNVASSREVGADGAEGTGVQEWYMPISSAGRARLAAAPWCC